jgi:hypothetical protein
LKIMSSCTGGDEYMLISQCPPLPLLSPALSDKITEGVKTFSFSVSQAFSIQAVLLSETAVNQSAIWFEATSDTCDGAAALGFTRALRQELPATEVQLVLFSANWSTEARHSIVNYLSKRISVLEPEMTVDLFGTLLVPRILPTSSPIQSFDRFIYWRLEGNHVLQRALPVPGPGRVLVKIHCVSKTEGQLQSVVGTVVRSASSKVALGERVVGIISPVLSNFAIIYEGQMAVISSCHSDTQVCNIALPLLFAALAIQLDTESSSIRKTRFLVTRTANVAEDTGRIMKHLGMEVLFVPPSIPQKLPPLLQGDVIVFGSTPAMLQGFNRTRSKFRLFNWTEDVLAIVNSNPSLVGHTLRTHLSDLLALSPPVTPSSHHPDHIILTGYELSRSVAFSPDKFYLIIGGMGSLGLQISIWLYKVCLSPAVFILI